VSRSEDTTVSGDSFELINSLQAKALRDQRGTRFVALPLPLEGVLHDSGSSMKHLALLLASIALYSATLEAQSSSSSVPESHRPPPGMCRIWIDGVPPTHQPAPTDCATAIRKRPVNARVVFGSEAPAGSGRNYTPAPRVQSNFAPQTSPSHEAQDRVAQQQREEQEHQRILQQQHDAQERARIDAQRQREEQQKREANHAPPPQTQHEQERAAPQQRPRTEKAQRPPSHARRPR
jgi:hypothetical protein